MDFGHLVLAAFQGPTGIAIWGIAVLAAVELVTGVLKAFAKSQFSLTLIDVWVRTQLAGRVLPIVIVLVAGAASPDFSVLGLDVNPLTALGLAGAATYAASAIASIMDNVNPAAADTPPTE
jgi:hypothetical protein